MGDAGCVVVDPLIGSGREFRAPRDYWLCEGDRSTIVDVIFVRG
jgi:hypothetical protein